MRPVGPMGEVFAEITESELDPSWQQEFVSRRAAGAVVSFAGVIRDHDGERDVSGLRYEAHPTAQRVLNDLAARLASSADVQALAVAHRVGELTIGDVALLCTVATAHRAAAFDVCERLVDAIKAQVPIWKHQRFTDGSTEWVGLPSQEEPRRFWYQR